MHCVLKSQTKNFVNNVVHMLSVSTNADEKTMNHTQMILERKAEVNIPLSTRIRGGGSEATGAFFFLNTYGVFLRLRIWATYSFFSIQHAFIDFQCLCAFCCKV